MLKIFIFIFLSTGATFAQKTKNAITIKATDNGKTFHVKKGKTFNAVFNECVGCASIYKVDKIDTAKIQLVSTKYSNRSCTNCTGGNHDVTFNFKALAKGKSILRFTYFKEVVAVTIIIDK